MNEMGIKNVSELVGTSLAEFTNTDKLDRSSIVYPVIDREKCVGCGRCYISCEDGGHQAIEFGTDRQPKVKGNKCVGCHLCKLVCPVGAITSSKRVLV
jgi:dihydropyrimidine dehydrogenase (NAD+) subunit PreA